MSQGWEASEVDGADAVAEVLRAAIHRGALLPGDQLPPERELAARFRIGRMTLRRALASLQGEGYLVSRRGAGGGTFVTTLDRPVDRWLERMRAHVDELDELLEYRLAVEVHVARLAARRRTAADLDRMHKAIAALAEVEDRARFRQLDSDFHLAVADAAGNQRLEQAVADCRAELFAATDQLEYDEVVTTMRAEHGAILDAIAAGDEDRAGQAMAAHLRSSREVLHRILASDA